MKETTAKGDFFIVRFYGLVHFDQYGVLRSDAIPDGKSFGIEDHVDLADEMGGQLGIKSWTVLGHSIGGMFACLYHISIPTKQTR